MHHQRQSARATGTLLALGLAALATPVASAQQADAAEATDAAQAPQAKSLDTVAVTASRAARKSGFTTPTPTTMVGAQEIQDSGVSVVADQLNKMPAFRATNTPASTTHSSQNAGGNYLNLRGMGPGRTLVLVNGNRHVPTNSSGWVDTNVIPTALVDHVEVVTGGASASWGSDAIAGVVNLIFKDHIDGIQGRFNYGISEQGDSEDFNGSLSAGTAFADGRGHFMIAGEFSRNGGVGSDRDWNRKHYGVMANPDYAEGNGQPENLIVADMGLSTATLGGLITSGPLKGLQFLPGGQTSQFEYGDLVGSQYMRGGDGLYPGDLINLVTPLKRGNVYTHTTFDIGDYSSAWFDASYAQSSSRFNLSTSYYLGAITIQRDNAYLPDSVQALMDANGVSSFSMGRVNEDIGYNIVDTSNKTGRVAGGFKGSFGQSWDWDVSSSYGQNTYQARIYNNVISSNFTAAVDAVADGSGNVVCRSTLTDPGNGCVPLNLFGADSPSQAAIDSITGTQWLRSRLKEYDFAANLRGEPFSTWAGPVSLAAGVEYRHESVDQQVDAISQASGFRIGNPKAMDGAYKVKEAYAEMILPLLADRPMAKSLDLTLGARGADYSESGFAKPWKLGLSYALDDAWRLRVTRSRDIRAPNISEMYNSYVLTFSTVTDPVTGVQSTVRAPAVGNTSLSPETAYTVTAGVIWQPQWLPGFQASLDWYDINLHGAIETLTAQDIVNRCTAGNPDMCDFIQRDASGAISEIDRAYVNVSSVHTKGVDGEFSYTRPVAGGRLDLRLMASYLSQYLVDDGTTAIDQADDVSNGKGPHWHGMLSASFERGPWRLYAEERYIGSGRYDTTASYDRNHVGSQSVLNLSAQYTLFAHKGQDLRLFAGIGNAFDKDPPVAPYDFIFGSSSQSFYDILGRRYNLGFSFNY